MTSTQESKRYNVIMTDELGELFSVTLRAFDIEHARESVRFSYPESSILAIQCLGV